MLRFLANNLEQLDLAQEHVSTGDANKARFGLMLTDNAVEITLHTDEGLMCLCGMLGAEITALPAPVAAAAKQFFERNVEWLTVLYRRAGVDATGETPRVYALRTIATLEGALIVARTLGDHSAFNDIADGVPPAGRTRSQAG